MVIIHKVLYLCVVKMSPCDEYAGESKNNNKKIRIYLWLMLSLQELVLTYQKLD